MKLHAGSLYFKTEAGSRNLQTGPIRYKPNNIWDRPKCRVQNIGRVRYDSAESGTTRPSRIRLDADRDESDTRYILYLNSDLNRLDSDDSTDIPS
ncbi:hypothetical protein VitviT2T_020805 [Vitis vinifera]|uniref:Uncharacterized protein n=1 Tax=Vitis vinifera TaxID=29760 RepID=A0ABY9D548_VITVI|nr:hypothetical protein VitviT2T_020805 [Vitis vinifera]